MSNHWKDYPMTDAEIVARLREFVTAITSGDPREVTRMCVPAQPTRDGDIVLSRAAARLEELSKEPPE